MFSQILILKQPFINISLLPSNKIIEFIYNLHKYISFIYKWKFIHGMLLSLRKLETLVLFRLPHPWGINCSIHTTFQHTCIVTFSRISIEFQPTDANNVLLQHPPPQFYSINFYLWAHVPFTTTSQQDFVGFFATELLSLNDEILETQYLLSSHRVTLSHRGTISFTKIK